MRCFSVIFGLAIPLLTFAAPARYGNKHQASIDIVVFQFAEVLEQFESTFYSQALTKFTDNDFLSAGYSSSQIIIEQITIIQIDESTHSSTLRSGIKALGGTPITTCQFDFSSVLTDVTTMISAARVIETVGVAAYIGGASLLSDPILLTAAASILTVEARHQTLLNIFSPSGTVIPSAFDIAFTPSEVLAIVSVFISGCDFGIPSNVPLTITNTGTVTIGTTLTFKATSITGSMHETLFCQMLVGGAFASISLPLSQCIVPMGINGPVAIFITNDAQPLLNNVVDRSKVNIVAGPTLAFIDTQPQQLNQLIIPGRNGTSPVTSTATLTVSPSQASSIVSGANNTSTTVSETASAVTATSSAGGETVSASESGTVSSSAATATAEASSVASTSTSAAEGATVTVAGSSD